MKGYLLDTSICVALFRGNKKVAEKLDAIDETNCFVNDVVVAELLVGAYNSERVEENLMQVRDFLSKIQIIPFAASVHEFAKERVKLWKAGNKIDDFDLLIGCAAKANNLTIVTHNVRHFEHIEGLIIDDWI